MIDKNLLDEYIKLLKSNTGIDFSKGNIDYLKRILNLKQKKQDIKLFLDILKKDKYKLQQFINDVTIGETYFFRNINHFNALKYILKDLLKEKSKITIWSAGCSIGCEPYTIAILSNEYLKEQFQKDSIKIIATDISNNFLSIAKKGIYTKMAVEFKTPKEYIKKYFIYKEGNYFLKDIIKSKVYFRYLNLLKDPFFTNIDIIFCRNVLIYFSKEDVEKVIMKFYNSINDGGFLFLGSSELLSSQFSPFFERIFVKNAYLYRKWTTDRRKLNNTIIDKNRRLNKSKPILKLDIYKNKIILYLEGVFDDNNFSYKNLDNIKRRLENVDIDRLFIDISKVEYISNKSFYILKSFFNNLKNFKYKVRIFSKNKLNEGLDKLYNYLKLNEEKDVILVKKNKEKFIIKEESDKILVIFSKDMFLDKKDKEKLKDILKLVLEKKKNIVMDFSKIKYMSYEDVLAIKRMEKVLKSENLNIKYLFMPSNVLKYFK